MAPSPREPLLYVLSSGRSGSTLLDTLLGTHRDVLTLGEAQLLPHEVRDERHLCGCGEPVATCPFWAAVLTRIKLPNGPARIERFRETHDHGRVLRPELVSMLTPAALGEARSEVAAKYGENNHHLIAAARDVHEAMTGRRPRWVVDASKDVYRLDRLERSQRFDLRVIHLTRDPRGFVHSMQRRNGRHLGHRTIRYALRWVVENTSHLALLSRLPSDQVRHVRYEDLASDPVRVLGDLATWLGLEPQDGWVDQWLVGQDHGLSGNSVRRERSPITPRQGWQRSLPRAHARITTAIAAPLTRRLGHVRPPAESPTPPREARP